MTTSINEAAQAPGPAPSLWSNTMMGFDAERILSDVPRLRRYAALMCSNDMERGDKLVELTLKDVLAKRDELAGKDDIRLILFRHLQNRLARELGADAVDGDATPPLVNGRHADGGLTDELLASLAGMPMEQRSVLLLVVTEGLAYEHVGYVLGTTTAIVRALLADARDHLETETAKTSKIA